MRRNEPKKWLSNALKKTNAKLKNVINDNIDTKKNVKSLLKYYKELIEAKIESHGSKSEYAMP